MPPPPPPKSENLRGRRRFCRNIHAALAASPRRASTKYPQGARGGAATRHEISTRRPRRAPRPREKRNEPAPERRRVVAAEEHGKHFLGALRVHARAAREAAAAEAARDVLALLGRARAVFAVVVVRRASLGVVQAVVGLRHVLEALLGALVVGVFVGMIFDREFSVRLLERFLVGVARHAEDFVVVVGDRVVRVGGRHRARAVSALGAAVTTSRGCL